jgi:hypothetical protein
MHLSLNEIIIGLIIFTLSGLFFRWLGSFIWRKKTSALKDKVTVISPKINELTIQEYGIDLKKLQIRLDKLNNDFLTENKNFKDNSERFRNINKLFLELNLRLNHIKTELEKEENKIFKTNKIKKYEKQMKKMKNSISLLNDELKRENDASQSYTLNTITMIELIFLPMGVLVGYFGMNFSSMGGHVGRNHKPAPGVLGFKYGQTFLIGLIILSVILIFNYIDVSKLEHFDIKKSQSCDETKEMDEILPFNEETLNIREDTMKNIKRELPDITKLPYNGLYFYKKT